MQTDIRLLQVPISIADRDSTMRIRDTNRLFRQIKTHNVHTLLHMDTVS